MQIHKILKDTIKNHNKKIELTQWAIINGISSLIYSEYIRRIQHKMTPIISYHLPEIRSVVELLKNDGVLMERLSNDLIDEMSKHYLMGRYKNAPELILFMEENIEIMKTIFDLYISPNIQRRIPESIDKKFGLTNRPNQEIRQDRSIDLFDKRPFSDAQFQFIVNQSCLQLLTLLPTMKKNIDVPEDNMKIFMNEDEILTIGNEHALCPIHFDSKIIDASNIKQSESYLKSIEVSSIDGQDILELLQFVTSTNFTIYTDDKISLQKEIGTSRELKPVKYLIKTNTFNVINIIHLEGIDEKQEVEGE